MGLNTLTRAQIIAQGLDQGGNPGLSKIPAGDTVSRAVRFFNATLHHVAMVYDLPQLETVGSITSRASDPLYEASITGLTRYRSMRSIRISGADNDLNPAVNYSEIYQKIARDLTLTPVPKGEPIEYFTNPGRTALVLYPIPDEVKTLVVTYYALPDIGSWTDATTDFTIIDDTLTLISMMEFFARNWDEKLGIAAVSKAWAETQFGQFRATTEDVGRHRPATMRLDPRVFRYKRDS